MSFADPWVNISDSRNTDTIAKNATPVNGSRESAIVDIASLEFEDNFIPEQSPLNPRQPQDNRLPDSDNYLATLGNDERSEGEDFLPDDLDVPMLQPRTLISYGTLQSSSVPLPRHLIEKRLYLVKNNLSVLQQLAERREACMQTLLGGNVTLRTEAELELEEPVNSNELFRLIRPEQALSQAEVVQLVQHDQLQLEAEEHEESREGEESGTESSTSR